MILSEKTIRALIKAKSPETQVSAKALALIDEIVGEYIEALLQNSLTQQQEMNSRFLKCNLPLKRRLNPCHIQAAQRRIARGE